MKRKTGILFKARAAAMLLAVMLTATTARAELTCVASPEAGGTVTVDPENPTHVFVTANNGYRLLRVTYSNGGTAATERWRIIQKPQIVLGISIAQLYGIL